MSLSEAKRLLLAKRLAGTNTAQGSTPVIPKRPGDVRCPLSANQRRIWFLHRANTASTGQYLVNGYWVDGALDFEITSQAVDYVVQRHEILRTVYRETDSEPYQCVLNGERVEIFRECVTGSLPEIESTAARLGSQPFDLQIRPPLRLLWLEGSETDRRLLLLVAHHIALDEWSVGLFWKEWREAYKAFAAGEEPDLPIITAQFGDFAYWERGDESRNNHGTLDGQRKFWREKLRDLPAPLRLPIERTTSSSNGDGQLEVVMLDATIRDGLKELGREQGASLFVLALAGFKMLLSRYTGAEDIVIGTPIANRRLPETAQMIGFLLGTVALRTQLKGNLNVAEVIRRVRDSTTEALANQNLPFDQVVEAVNPARIPDQQPIFQIMFVHLREEEAMPLQPLAGATFELAYINLGASKFDLTVFVAERDRGLELVAEYRGDKFDGSAIRRLLGHLGEILREMVADPNRCMGELDYLTGLERREILEDWQGESLRDCEDVVELIWRNAAKDPDHAAVESRGSSQSYRQITSTAERVASEIVQAGLKTGDFVGVFLQRGSNALAAILGILRAGCAYVPIDPSYPSARCEWMLQHSNLAMLVVDDDSLASVPGETATSILNMSEPIDRSGDPERNGLEQAQIDPEAPAYMIYTSGSTGEPKGVVVTRANLSSSTAARVQFYTDQPKRYLLLPSLSFDSSVAGIYWTLAEGGTLVLPEPDQSRDIVALHSLAATVDTLLCIPSLYAELLRVGASALTSLKRVIVAGETCGARLVRDHFGSLQGARLFNEYGPTEATVWATACECHPVSEAGITKGPSIGRPIAGVVALILDERQRLVPAGFEGELWIGGAGVAIGYKDNEALTRERFVPSPFSQIEGRLYKTGDRARWTESGEIEFLGRVDRQVKLRGYRIELEEVESVLATCKGVAEASVVARQSVETSELAAKLLELPESEREHLLAVAEREPQRAPGKIVRREKFQLRLEEASPDLVNPPLATQRQWLLNQAMAEFADDLEHLDRVASKFVPGSRAYEEGTDDISQAELTPSEIMEDWQTPLMQAMAMHVCERHGDVLEIGFGRGVSAEFIQQLGVRSHTIVEVNDHSVQNHFKPWRETHAAADIKLYHARWEDVEPELALYDGIFFHAFPLNEEEYVKTVLQSVTFAEHAFDSMSRHLRPGGVFTYLTTEIDSFSRRHQRALFKHFSSIELSVQKVDVPEHTHDAWWADSMVVIKAVK